VENSFAIFLKKIFLSYFPIIMLLGIHPSESKTHVHTKPE
jgi:hypothetical protein